VLPPGLVAASSLGQGGLGGGFQSMGLGLPTDQPGRFGRFSAHQAADSQGFRSIDVASGEADAALTIRAAETIDLLVPSVCLNFGVDTPTPRNIFHLVDVDEYTQDPRARKALRSLATLGTSQGVAQVVAWYVFNQMSYAQIAQQGSKYINPDEVSVAARFVDALDASGDSELVDPAYFQHGRILLRVTGQNSGVKAAARLREEMATQRLFGLPAQVVDEISDDNSRVSSLLVDLQILGPGSRPGQTKAKALVRHNAALGGWTRLGSVDLTIDSPQETLTAEALAAELDRGIAAAFVSATPAKRSPGQTTLRVVNRLPFTLQNVVLRTSRSENAPVVTLEGLGVGPRRSAMAAVPAPLGLVDRVEINGL
jgi:hypothetical protein